MSAGSELGSHSHWPSTGLATYPSHSISISVKMLAFGEVSYSIARPYFSVITLLEAYYDYMTSSTLVFHCYFGLTSTSSCKINLTVVKHQTV